MRLGVVFS
ncbi:unnamed protein product [Linum tenue]|uniref:Uncharacterized protein n=1 Tax=Linum tenue TaxID=586396 RepID=A0AAV0LUG7_9ROSI|nr:unnamed protein product [Linum tenue]